MADFLNDMFHHSSENLMGGQDYFAQDGSHLGHSADNVFGGENFHDSQGHFQGHSADNILGGEDFFDAQGNKVGYTAGGLGGGETLFDATGQQVGSFNEAAGAVQFHSTGGDVMSFRQNLMGGLTADPLNNMASVSFPSLF